MVAQGASASPAAQDSLPPPPPQPARSAALMLAIRATRQVFVLVAIIVAQNALGASGYGEYSTLIVLSQLSSVLFDLGTQVAMTREVARHTDQLRHMMATVLGVKLPLAVLAAAGLTLLTAVASPSLLPYVPPLFLLMAATALSNLFRAPFYIFGELRFESCAIVLETIVLVGLTITVALHHGGVAAYIWAYAASYTVSAIFAAIITWRRYTPLIPKWDGAQALFLIRRGAPFALSVVLNTLYFKLDVVILQAMRGFAQVGYYNAAYRFIDGISFVPQAIVNVMFPRMAHAFHAKGMVATARMYGFLLRLLMTLGMPIAVITALRAHDIIVVTHVLSLATPSLAILGASIFFIFVANSFMFVLGAIEKQRFFAYLMVMSIVVNVALNIVWILMSPARDGYLASSWATLATEVALVVVGLACLRHFMGHTILSINCGPPVIAGTVMIVGLLIMSPWSWIAAIPLSCVVYIVVLAATGGIRRGDLLLLKATGQSHTTT